MSNKPKIKKTKKRIVSEPLASVVALFPHALLNESGTKVVVTNTVGGN
jgi:hypothetical protein